MADFEYVTHTSATPPVDGQRPPLDLSHHYSRVTKARVASNVKKFYKYFAIPGIVNLAGGKRSRFGFGYSLNLCVVNSPRHLLQIAYGSPPFACMC